MTTRTTVKTLLKPDPGQAEAQLEDLASRLAPQDRAAGGMVPLLGPPTPGSATRSHPAVLVAAEAGLVILDAGPAWRADPVNPTSLDSAPLHLRPSRMRFSPQDRTLTSNYDVHDVLTCVGMVDVVTVLASAPHDVASAETSVIGRVDRIYLTRNLADPAAGYVQKDLRDSEHRAIMLTLDQAKAPPEEMTKPQWLV